MLPYRIQVTIDPDPSRSRGKVREVLREAHREQAQHWQQAYAPLHFAPGASAKYGYRPRTATYRRHKRAAFRTGLAKAARRDLVYSGLTQQKVRQPGAIKAYPTRARLTLYTPGYIRIRHRGNRPNLAAEILRIIRPEGDEMARRMATTTERGLSQIRTRYTVTL